MEPPIQTLYFLFRGSNHWGLNLFAHSISNARKHSRSTAKHNVPIQILSDINITLHYRIIRRLMNSSNFHSDQRRLIKYFRTSKTLSTNSNHLFIRQFIVLLNRGACLGCLKFLLEIKSKLCQFLLHIHYNFLLCTSSEGVSAFSKNLHHVLSKVTASKVYMR